MRLYPKKLNSVNDLQKERRMLREKIKQQDADGIFGGSTSTRTDKKEKDVLSSLGDFFFNHPFASVALNLAATPVIKKAGKKAGKSVFSIGKEVLGGYAKWKAMEIGYRWIRRTMKSRKEKNESK